MNYIPGFTNYLQSTVPAYADGGRVMAVEPTTQEAAPYDLSGLAGVDLSSLYGMNFGTDFGGGAMGGIYPDDPNTEYVAAPLSNKGNFTAQSGNAFVMGADQPVRLVDHSTNTVVFQGTGYDAARKATELGQGLSDTLGRKANYSIQTADPTGKYSTVANEKANKSTLGEIANVAGTVLPLAMMAVPGLNVAAGKLLGSQLLGSIALGAGTGGLSAGLKGDNILKGAALGGITAAGGALIPKIQVIGDLGDLARPIGTGIGATAGGLATGQSLKNSLLGGAASGALAYAAPSIQDALKGIGAAPSTGGNAAPVTGGPNAGIIVNATPSFSAPINLGGYKTPAQKAIGETAEPTLEEILVNARPSFTPPVNLDLSTVPTGGLNTVAEPTPEEILVNARKTFTPPVNLDLSTIPTGGLDTVTPTELKEILVKGRETLTPPVDLSVPTTTTGGLDTVTPTELEEILVNARKTLTLPVNLDLSTVPTGGLDTLTAPELKEILVKGRETLTPPVDLSVPTTTTGGLDTVTPTELEEILVKGRETLTPPVNLDLSTTPPGGTDVVDDTIKVTGRRTVPAPPIIIDTPPAGDDTKKVDPKEEEEKKKKLGVEEYLRLAALAAGLIGGGGGKGQTGYYGGGGSGRLNPIFSAKLPAAGGLGTIGAARTPRAMGDVDWLTYGTRPELSFFDYAPRAASPTPAALPTPVTTPMPSNPAGPIMAEEPRRFDEGRLPPRFAEGGAFAAKGGGLPKRTEFAVNGAGTGRSDDIPAVLSDGEYVIDAETVALLGDGSNKAGAKKLDELRIKVRKHKGRKLAKGRFSANAKKPEAYLSGGRI